VAKEEIAKRVAIAAKTLKMEALLDRKPKDMSGGQRQRVAIGRAIVRDPKVFLFDEPLSNLDAELRVEMRLQIAKLHHELGNTMIYVTHDQVEAMTLADKIVVLRSGNVEQVGSPLELYHAPANEFVAGFIGSPKMNFVDALVDDLDGDQASVRLPDGQIIALSVNSDLVNQGEKVRLGIRPEHIHTQANQGDFSVSFQSEVVERLGNSTYLFGNYCGKDGFKVHIQGDKSVGLYEYISLGIHLSDCHLFNAEGVAVGKREIPIDSKH
jgi:multiple sugar transport system ATP-binding protein